MRPLIALAAVVLALALAAAVPSVAVADPSRNTETVALSCDNGFRGTVTAIPFTPIEEANLVTGSTSAFIIVSATIFRPDGTFVFAYQKPGERSGQSFTTCDLVVETGPAAGFYGTTVGYFTPKP